jgi:HAD superfamily hydrolase (TIGR01450 family)
VSDPLAPRPARTVLFDLDGTIYLRGELYPGVRELVAKLAASGLRFGFLTNNSSVGPEAYVRRLRGQGLDIGRQHVLTSAEATCPMLAELGLGPDLYLVGTRAFGRFLSRHGYRHSYERANAVLVGFDTELTYRKLTEATRLLLERRLPLVASHPDPVCPGPLPDAGMLLAYFQAADPGIRVAAVAGKPNRWIVELVRQRFACAPDEVVMVGDRLDTDVAFAAAYKMRSILVLNGARPPVSAAGLCPDAVAATIADVGGPCWPPDLGWT